MKAQIKRSPSDSGEAYGSIQLRESVLNGRLKIYDMLPAVQAVNLDCFLWNMEDLVRDVVEAQSDGFNIKARMLAKIWFHRDIGDDSVENTRIEERLFHMSSGPCTFIYNFDDWYMAAVGSILTSLESFYESDCIWIPDRIERIELKMAMIENPLER